RRRGADRGQPCAGGRRHLGRPRRSPAPTACADHDPGARAHAPAGTGGDPVTVVDLGPLIDAGAAGSSDPFLAATVATSHPIVLLPVRVETRYADTLDGRRELLVRVWPD